jgi:hypothetical protein
MKNLDVVMKGGSYTTNKFKQIQERLLNSTKNSHPMPVNFTREVYEQFRANLLDRYNCKFLDDWRKL